MEKIVFFGSGPVAAKSLELLNKSFVVEAVVTKPSTQELMHLASPGTSILTVSSKSELDELITKQRFGAKLAILIDFGIIVSQTVIDSFPLGIVNSHFSLLPELRGADPISFAILEGLSRTGVSLMLLNSGLDEGPILAVGIENLNGTETTPDLTEKLVMLSDSLLKKTIPNYLNNSIKPIDQTDISNQIEDYPSEPSYSRKLTKQDGIIDWHKPAEQIEREIRAFAEWPKSHAKINGKEVIITRSQVSANSLSMGEVSAENNRLLVGAKTGVLEILRLKPASKQDMSASDFIRGYFK
jgi:methionyl-tRNA formyltransferase